MKRLLLPLTIFFILPSFSQDKQLPVAIISEETNLRNGPSYYNDYSLLPLHKGDHVVLLKHVQLAKYSDIKWVQIMTIGKKVGYIVEDFIDTSFTQNMNLINADSVSIEDAYTFMSIHGERLVVEENLRANKMLDSMQRKLDSIYKARQKYVLSVNQYYIENNVLGYPDFNVTIENYKPKTIKYIWFTVAFYNPVDDLVATKVVQGIGPIGYHKRSSYEFNSVVVSKLVKSFKITAIKIQYMDGSFAFLPANKIPYSKDTDKLVDYSNY